MPQYAQGVAKGRNDVIEPRPSRVPMVLGDHRHTAKLAARPQPPSASGSPLSMSAGGRLLHALMVPHISPAILNWAGRLVWKENDQARPSSHSQHMRGLAFRYSKPVGSPGGAIDL